MHRILRLVAGAGIVVLVVAATAGAAWAHPLGNVSVNHYAGLVLGTDDTRIDYVLDLAELPTVRARQQIDTDGDGAVDATERRSYEGLRCGELADGIELRLDGQLVPVEAVGGALEFLPGSAGLDTLRLECDLRAQRGVSGAGTVVTFRDANSSSRVGWREVTAVGDEVSLEESDVPAGSISARLSNYPDGAETLVDTDASLVATPGGPPAPVVGASPFGERARAATDRFTSLIASDDTTVPLVVTSLVVAVVFGALHSLAPGHGKSVIAAYLLGQRRDRRLAFLLGGTVAITHTASVLVFGAIISLTETAAPEAYYPLFGVVSGLLFVALGLALLRQVVARGRARSIVRAPRPAPALAMAGGPPPVAVSIGHSHDDHGHSHAAHDHDHSHDDHGHSHAAHDHDHSHDHGDGWHDHEHVDLGAVASGELGWRAVVLPGLAGGVVPSPSALLVFLGGLALGRAWFGIGLVLGYGVGIAATLVTAGWLLARAGDRMTGDTALGRFPRLARLATYLPALTAVLVILGGLHIAARAVA